MKVQINDVWRDVNHRSVWNLMWNSLIFDTAKWTETLCWTTHKDDKQDEQRYERQRLVVINPGTQSLLCNQKNDIISKDSSDSYVKSLLNFNVAYAVENSNLNSALVNSLKTIIVLKSFKCHQPNAHVWNLNNNFNTLYVEVKCILNSLSKTVLAVDWLLSSFFSNKMFFLHVKKKETSVENVVKMTVILDVFVICCRA